MAYLLQRLLTEAAARQPQRPAVASDGCLLTYQELDRLSNKVARALLRLGVAPGDRVAGLKQQGRSAPAEAAAAKLFISESWVRSSQDAIQVHGAFGYMKEAGIERDLRDAIAGTIYSGTSEIQRVVLARMLGL